MKEIKKEIDLLSMFVFGEIFEKRECIANQIDIKLCYEIQINCCLIEDKFPTIDIHSFSAYMIKELIKR